MRFVNVPGVFIALLLAVGVQAKSPTNIILVIGDGMAPAYTSAYRYYADDPATPHIETTIFDELLVGMARTYPNDNTVVTDSAAAATALATGVKTFNGAIGVDTQHQPLETLLELAKKRRYQTAVVATSTINHATPASFIAHVKSRQSYNAIADQFIDERINGKPKIDLMFGGGRKFFVREDRNIAEEFVAEGYRYITSLDQLASLDRLPIIGLFADDGLPSALNSDRPLALTEMTAKALALLGKKPFFLLVEASQIDWCGHANDIACAMAEMHDMAETLKLLKAYVDKNRNTILVATADHGTGGLSIGANGKYAWDVAVIKNIKATASRIADNLMMNSHAWQEEWTHLTGIDMTPREMQGMQQLMDKADELKRDDAPQSQRDIVRSGVVKLTLALINERSHTGWTTTGHTGDDVQVFSYGENSRDFAGNINNTDIAKKLFAYLPKK